MKKLRRPLQDCTNQIGRGNTQEEPAFEIVTPPENNYFHIEVKQSKSFKKKIAAKEVTYLAKLKNPAANVPLMDLSPQLHVLFETILSETRRTYGDAGVMRIYITHPQLESAIIVPPTYLGDLDSETILRKIDEVMHSASSIPADNEIEINAAVVEYVTGSSRLAMIDIDEDRINKRAIVTIKNQDNLCLPRAILVGYAHLRQKKDPTDENIKKYNRIRDSRLNYQRDEAIAMRKIVGIPNRAGTIDDVYLYEDYLKVSIIVIGARAGNSKVYPGSPKYEDKIFVYHHGEPPDTHFDTIVKMNSLINKSYYCEPCDKGFQNRNGHKCPNWCNICGRENCEQVANWQCPHCNKVCRSKKCFLEHRKHTRGKGKMKNVLSPSMCEQYWDCRECGEGLKRIDKDSHDVSKA